MVGAFVVGYIINQIITHPAKDYFLSDIRDEHEKRPTAVAIALLIIVIIGVVTWPLVLLNLANKD